MRLRQLQREFKKSLDTGRPSSSLKPMGNLSPDLGLKIYREAIEIRRMEALSEDYNLLEKRMGKARFKKAVHLYLQKNSTKHRSLNQLGEGFPRFLKVKKFPAAVVEFAQLEWEMVLKTQKTAANKDFKYFVSDFELLKLNPQKTAVIYKKSGRVFYRFVNSTASIVLQAIQKDRSMNAVVLLAEKLKISNTRLKNMFALWAKENIILGYRT